jgi:hypothetical protein
MFARLTPKFDYALVRPMTENNQVVFVASKMQASEFAECSMTPTHLSGSGI